jgi:signal transduction histidine kinase/CheY-like chemotaxis protein
LTFNIILPDELGDGNCLFIRTNRNFTAYIDGEPRNSYDIKRAAFGPNVKPIWLAITLRRSDVGKELSIVLEGYHEDTFTLSEVYFGNRLGFSMQLIHNNIYIVILSFALMVLGSMTAAICIMKKIRDKAELNLWYLSMGVLSGALWLISNNFTYPLLFGNYLVDGVVSYMIILLLPYAFVSYARTLTGDKYRLPYTLISITILISFWTLTILDFNFIAPYDKTAVIADAVICIAAVFCLTVIFYDSLVLKNKGKKLIAIGFLGFVLSCVAEVVHLGIPNHHNNGVFVAIGLLFLITCAGIQEIRNISNLRAEMIDAQRASRAKTDFLANMSHEIRTPMNAVIGMTEIAMREDLSPTARDCIIQIQKSGKNLLNIINDILDYSKIDSGKLEIIPEKYELSSELNDISNILATRIGSKELELYVACDLNVPNALLGDSMRIRQVLINLVNNAIKFTNKGSVGVTVSFEKTCEDTCLLTYHIKDTGIGIKEEDLEKIFVSFQQVDSKRNRSVEGTGLGLAISKRLVEAMGGELGVESVYGEGSDFWFTIPQKILDPNIDLVLESPGNKRVIFINNDPVREKIFLKEMNIVGCEEKEISDIREYTADDRFRDFVFFDERKTDKGVAELLKANPGVIGVAIIDFNSNFKSDISNMHLMRRPVTTQKIVRMLNEEIDDSAHYDDEAYSVYFTAPDAHILIVDDNAINITIAEGLLSPLEMKIDTALSGVEAIEKVKDNEYDIVLMDHMMPEMDGVETTGIIRENSGKEHPVIIALSANVTEEARKLFAESGMDDFVAKPIDIKEIVLKIKKWLPAEKIIKGAAHVFSGNDSSDPLLELEMIDAEAAVRSLGSAKLLRKIAKEYYEAGEKNLSDIMNAYEKDDIKDFTIRIHALKSSSRQIGELELGEKAEALENAGKKEDREFIKNNLPDCMGLYKTFLSELSKCFVEDSEDKKDAGLITDEKLSELLNRLKDVCENLDMDGMDSVKEDLEQYSWPEDKKAFLGDLCEAISMYDSIACEGLISKII